MNAKRMMTALLLCLTLLLAGAMAEATLEIPTLTETICTWNAQGLIETERVVDLNGKPALNAKGYASSVYAYDERGNLQSTTWYDLNGQPVNTIEGYASVVYTRENGVLTAEERFLADGSRAEIPGSYSFMRRVFDGSRLLSTSYYHADGTLVRPERGMGYADGGDGNLVRADGGYAQILNTYTEEGDYLLVTSTWLDTDGSMMVGPDGSAIVEKNYRMVKQKITSEDIDQEKEIVYGLLLQTAYYNAAHQPVQGSARWHRMVNEYDRNNLLIRTDYYDAENLRTLTSDGYSAKTCAYDERKRLVEECWYGVDDRLIRLTGGYARKTYEYYGATDRVHFETYYGADDERAMTTGGYSKAEYEYGGNDFDYRITMYDTVDQYTQCLSGYCRIDYLFERGLENFDDETVNGWTMEGNGVNRVRTFGTDLKLITVKAGHAGYINERNAAGQVTRTTYYDADWKPVRNEEMHYASIAFTYDSNDPKAPAVYECYFDADGNPTESVHGYYARRMEYSGSKNSHLVKETFLGKNDEPDFSTANGAYAVAYTHDANLLTTSVRYFGADGQPMMAFTGYATMLREYNERGEILWEVTMAADGGLTTARNPYAIIVNSYDAAGRRTGTKTYGKQNQALAGREGYASSAMNTTTRATSRPSATTVWMTSL